MALEHAPQRVVLKQAPEGKVKPDDFRVEAQEIPQAEEGSFVVRNLYVSVDPMLRLLVDKAPLGGAMPSLPAGSVIPGAAVGEVVESRHPDFRVGELVEGRFGWQNYASSDGVRVNRVSAALGSPVNALGVGGLPGFTAYVGLDVAKVQPGQTVLVSGAAGAVGSVVGPLLKARGARAVGIASGSDKARFLVEEAGYAAVADRTAPDFPDQLKAALPDGANVYFDNVGGPLLATIAPFMARGGLVLICGLMAQYQGASGGEDNLPAVLQAVMSKALHITTFSQFGREDLRSAFEAEIARLINEGALRPQTHLLQGLDQLPHALCGLFERGVPGKVVVQVAQPDQPNREKILEESN